MVSGGTGGKHKHDKENRENKNGLTEKLLNDKNNVIGEWRGVKLIRISLYRELPALCKMKAVTQYLRILGVTIS